MDTNNSTPNVFGDLVPSLSPDLTSLSSNNYSLEAGPSGRSGGGGSAPLIFGEANDVIDFRVASNDAGRRPINVFVGEGYDFSESKAVKNGKFVGLGIDEDNQPELTDQRVKQWVAQIRTTFGV